MHRIMLKALPIALMISSAAYGQSLADVARQNREKQKAKAASSSEPQPRVITNDNLLSASAGAPAETVRNMKPVPPETASKGPSAEEWKSQILAQKNVIAAQQAEIDKVNNSVHFVTASLYSNGIQYNEHQAQKQQSVAQMQHQLEEQKQKLAEMQEAARQAGMGSAVYEP